MDPDIIKIGEKSYTLKRLLGEGNYGQTWLATSNGKKYAVKKVLVDLETDGEENEDGSLELPLWGHSDNDDYDEYYDEHDGFQVTSKRNFLRETKLAKKVARHDCPTLIKYLGKGKGHSMPTKEDYKLDVWYILMEYFKGYTFKSLIECQKKTGFTINPNQFLIMAKHLFQGLVCLHKVGVAHSDLHPGNIMFNEKEMKIIDFGQLCTSSEYYSCYIDHHWIWNTYKDYPSQPKDTLPFKLDVKSLGLTLKEVGITEKFKEKNNKDPKTDEIISWLDDLIGSLPKYTAQEALNELYKIDGEIPKELFPIELKHCLKDTG
jgi:serine/threonine protein kinase